MFADSSLFSVIQYNIYISGALSALIMCTIQDCNETHVIECGLNGQWSIDIANVCNNPLASSLQWVSV